MENITLEHIKLGEELKTKDEAATTAWYKLKELGLTTEELEKALDVHVAAYKSYQAEVCNHVFKALPAEAQAEIGEAYRPFYFPSTVLAKDNKIKVTLYVGSYPIYLAYDIVECKPYYQWPTGEDKYPVLCSLLEKTK